MESFIGLALTLFFVMDALGHIPTYLTLMKSVEKKKRARIALRESFLALAIMLLFYYSGRGLLTLLGVSPTTVQMSGGLVLFLIAIRLIFSEEEKGSEWKEGSTFLVPIATPIIAGPALLSIIMIFAQDKDTSPFFLGAILVAWAASALLFLFADRVYGLLKEKGLMACQRLMGLIVILISVQFFLDGLAEMAL